MTLKDQFEALAQRVAKKSPEEIDEIIKKATDTKNGRSELGRAMSAFITDNLSKRRFGPIEQLTPIKCSSCSVEYYDVHPDNGCNLGIVQNVSDS
jgi:hypothetical protein